MKNPDEARPESALVVDVVVDGGDWRAGLGDVESLCADALEEAVKDVTGLAGVDAEVTVLLTDDARVQGLNAEFRNRDRATNVLSFPALDDDTRARLCTGGGFGGGVGPYPAHLGDIAVAYETTAREAEEAGKPFAHHLAHLVVHGFLHLVGHDHEADDEAEIMEGLERRILARLEIPDPYSI